VFNVFLSSNDLGDTLVAKTSGPLELGTEYLLFSGNLSIPEPSSVVLGLFAATGLAAVCVRRYRRRRA
jgi:MYXO-CTERM domain-containing protein